MLKTIDSIRELEAEVLVKKERIGQLEKETEELKTDATECEAILTQGIKEGGVSAVRAYRAFPKYNKMKEELGIDAFQKGFKLCRWVTKHKFLELNFGIITSIEIITKMVLEAAKDLDSDEEGDEELDKGAMEKDLYAAVGEVATTDKVVAVEPTGDPGSVEGGGKEPLSSVQ
uniref:Uncharacterized protein n=1 Tax=Nelumbo nucifera TaxID=4432 RepID=A0A822ZNW0_NELNU|nr:TPA_asm: hypothetical protein HUJ06_003289 [Nelumbo nucifera]